MGTWGWWKASQQGRPAMRLRLGDRHGHQSGLSPGLLLQEDRVPAHLRSASGYWQGWLFLPSSGVSCTIPPRRLCQIPTDRSCPRPSVLVQSLALSPA